MGSLDLDKLSLLSLLIISEKREVGRSVIQGERSGWG